MEASRFGFGGGAAAAYKFDPTEADIVAHYLLPRALGFANPNAHAIIDDDPANAPPWEVLRRNGHASSDHAFFFAPPTDEAVNGGRRSRTVAGGTWQGQGSFEETLTLVRGPGGGAELDIKYKRYHLSFYPTKGSRRSTGFVMHEFQIISPPLPGAILSRIRVTERAKEYMATLPPQQEEPNAASDQVIPMLLDAATADQAPSNYQYHDAVTAHGEGSMRSGMAETDGYYAPESGGGECSNYWQYQDQLDPSSYQNQAVNAAEGFNIAQTGNGDGMGETTGRYDSASTSIHSAWEGGGDNSQYNSEFFHGEVQELHEAAE